VFKIERMSGPRILVLFGLLLLVAGVVIGLPSSLAPAAVVIAAAAVLVLFGADRSSPNPGSRSDPVTSVRAAFGPAVDAMDAVAVYTLDRSGRIGYANRGARRVLDVDGRDVEGRSASELPAAGSETPEMVEGLNEVFETGRPRVARRIMLLADGTTRVESIVSMTPVVRYGKVVEAAVWRVDTRGPAGGDEHRARLLDSSPAGLLGVDASGRIEAVSRRLAEWVGRRADALEGLDVERTEVLPEALRGHIRAQAVNRAPQGTPTAIVEDDVALVTPEGVSRMFHVLVAPRPGGGADAVFLEGGSRRRLLAELDAARRALAEARETAMDVLQSTTRDLKARVQEIVAAARRAGDETSGPIQRARAEAELLASSDEFLARVGGAVPEDDGSGRRSIGGADGRPRVLLVEDNEENRELLAHMLRSRGAEVLTAANGREAVDAAAGFRFDFVLLDLQMPAMDGFQVLRRLRALPGGDRLPVVALTALTSDLVKERCEAEGMNDFVSKPVTLARIGELVAKWGRGGITTSSGTASRKR
jgi:CheY-like chemotaxis protein